jgi:hypothetical protein
LLSGHGCEARVWILLDHLILVNVKALCYEQFCTVWRG